MGSKNSQIGTSIELTSSERHIAAKKLCQAARESESEYEAEALRKAADEISPH